MKTYLVIGAGPGIGLATAGRFAAAGYRVVIAARNPSRLEPLIRPLRDAGHSIEFEQIDASRPAEVAGLVRKHGPDLAVLHYNAGVLHYDANGQLQPRRLEDETVDTLTSETTVNLTSALAAVQAARDVMTTRGQGTILLTGGGFGIEPTSDFLNISIAKAALRAATKALFSPLQAEGIHIATVTVSTVVAAGTGQSVEIAEAFFNLHAQARPDWTWETIYS
ncbi:SDR family NAD(P)-dependent oxidoreductase [Paraburkholderia acidicola]|uniref:SDR family NAD(P)-dependent oxidoreductase n=1 Tax=Paraburkholderia acidicola TaxID=1912599 RepID=A0ABV1LWZ5_9BURK